MACKTVKKKAAYKAHCREEVKQGNFNDHEGNSSKQKNCF